MRRALMVIVAVVACAPKGERPPTTTKASTAKAPGVITEKGGVVGSSEGAHVEIPAGAVRAEATFAITRVTGDALKEGWPTGAGAGYLFEPPGQSFRIPVLVELPNEGSKGEASCESVSGQRTFIPLEAAEANHYHFHVTELPKRCTVFTEAHAAAIEAAMERHGAVVAKQNAGHKWEVQSELCNPNIFLRPNTGRQIKEPPGIGGCPAGMAPIPGPSQGAKACVDRWEAHVVEVLEDGSSLTWSPYFNPGAIKIKARSAPNAVPQGYVSQVQAEAACKEAGKRLCTDTEWVAACKGSKNTQFPYGNTEKRGACNDHRDKHPAVEYLESTDVYSRLEHPCINQVPETVHLTGTTTECVSPDEVFDMVGNLHEWTADKAGTFRGGYYVEAKLNGTGCDYVTTRHDAIYWDYSVGFRCCAGMPTK